MIEIFMIVVLIALIIVLSNIDKHEDKLVSEQARDSYSCVNWFNCLYALVILSSLLLTRLVFSITYGVNGANNKSLISLIKV